MPPQPLLPADLPTITLSETDWVKLLELLDTPPAPNDALKALLAGEGPNGDNKPFTIAE